MRIAINALYLIPGGVGGTEVYLRRLVEALEELNTEHEFVVFTNRETGALGRECVQLPVRASFRPGRILYEQLALPAVLRRERIDVLLNPGFTAPLPATLPQVTVFHDLQHKRHPEYFRWFDLPFWQFLLWASAKRSTRLIAVSESTRDDLLKYYGVRSEVVHHGVEPEFFALRERREDSGYLLCASTTHPHKNHERLLRAFAALKKEKPDVRLVLTGVRGFAAETVDGLVRELRLEQSVEIKGWLSREELYEVFRRARGLVYPSRFEGFGMPVLEAMAAGLPVACSGIEPLRSLAGGHALLFSPDSTQEMLAAMLQLALGAVPTCPAEYVANFTWERAAKSTLHVIQQAAAGD